jgi:hypothetical protein
LRAYFIPLPRVGFTLQGLSLLKSRSFSSKSRALMTFSDFRLPFAEADDASSSPRASKALPYSNP